LVAGPLLAVYLATASWGLPEHIDPLTNAITAWSLGTRGTPAVPEYAPISRPGFDGISLWFMDGRSGPTSVFPPGAALVAAPLYAMFAREAETTTLEGHSDLGVVRVSGPVPSLAPSAVVGSFSTALAMGALALVFMKLSGSGSIAVFAGMVAGLATGAWSVAANALWQHGPAMAAIALGLWLVANQRWRAAGWAFGAALVIRPLTGVIVLVLAIGAALGERSARRVTNHRPLLHVVPGLAAGLAFLLLYNLWAFGSVTPTGAADGPGALWFLVPAPPWWKNVALALFSWDRGLFIWSPVIAVTLVGVGSAWRSATSWGQASACGGVLYLGLTYAVSHYSGGDGFYFYRFPLEALVAAAPLLVLAGMHVAQRGIVASVTLLLSFIASTSVHAMAAVFS
jgi:hypothetical protein